VTGTGSDVTGTGSHVIGGGKPLSIRKMQGGFKSDKTTQEVPWNMLHWFFIPIFDNKWEKTSPKSKLDTAWGPLQEA